MATKRIENLVKSVSNRLQPVLEFDRFYTALYDPIQSLVEFPWVTQNGQPIEWPSRPYQPTTWLPDSIIQTKTSRLVEQNLEQELKDGGLEYWPEGDPPKSWLAVPMIVENRAIGAIVVENQRKPRAFGENGLRVLSSVARQTAQAVENARLVERLNALYKMGPELSSRIRLGEPAILRLIYEQASELMDTSNLYVALYDSATDIVRFPLMYVDGRSTQVESRSGGKGRTEWIIRTRKPIFIETRDESVKWYREQEGTDYIQEPFASWIGVPMIARDEVLGVIATYHKTQDYVYTKDDQEILSLMANQAAVALENARLYANLEKRNVQLAALQAIGVEITSQLDLKEVLGSIAEHANTIMSADFSTIFSYDAVQNRFDVGVRRGNIMVEPSTPSNTGFSAQVAKSAVSVFAENVESSGAKSTFIENKKVKSFAGIRLLSKGKTVGILYVNYLERHFFSEEERDVIGLLANQAAVAIENARLHQQVGAKVQELERAQEQIAEREAVVTRAGIAADFVHRLNNFAGTIPIWVDQIRDHIGADVLCSDKILADYLDRVDSDAERLLRVLNS